MKHVLLLFLLLMKLPSLAQKQAANWYFGSQAGIQFTPTGLNVLTDGQIQTQEGTTVISDSSGNLLMYSDGITVWNRYHTIMPNGTGLMGHTSTTQSGIFVPSPADPDRYFYLFTVGEGTYAIPSPKAAYYSLIDLCADNGKGDIVSNQKNIMLGNDLVEKMCVTRHANGVDYWIMTRKYPGNEYYAFLLTANGIQDTVVTSIGTPITNWSATIGQMKFSHNGQYLFAGASNVQPVMDLMRFDNATGILYDFIDIEGPNNDLFTVYGAEFSPDNSKLYVSGRKSGGIIKTILAQYSIDNYVDTSINSSLQLIYEPLSGYVGGFGMQLGLDNKIYIHSHASTSYLGTIEFPNNFGVACNYNDSAVYLNGKFIEFTLTSFIAGFDYSNTMNKCEISNVDLTELSDNPSVQVLNNPFSEYIEIQFPKEDIYVVSIYDLKGNRYFSERVSGLESKFGTGSLNSGCYILEVKSNLNTERLRIIKM